MEAETILLQCPHCGHDTAIVYPRGPHYRADCASCDRYIKFVPKEQVHGQRRIARYLGEAL